MYKWIAGLVMAGLLIIAMWQLGQAGMLAAKAWAAPILVEKAWAESLETGKPTRPWSWADTYPTAKIAVPELKVERLVLAEANMRNLAFGPVLSELGASRLVYGHRDTHFGFLKDLKVGAKVQYQNSKGAIENWSVQVIEILKQSQIYVEDGPKLSSMTFITCYPFDQIFPDTPYRYVVRLQRVLVDA